MQLFFLPSLLMLLLEQPSKTSASFLWKIDTQPPSYLFGTIHVPYYRVLDTIPNAVKVAFYRADNVYLELNLTDKNVIGSVFYQCREKIYSNLDLTDLPQTMDVFIATQAKQMGKKVGGLETPGEHCAVMVSQNTMESNLDLQIGMTPVGPSVVELLEEYRSGLLDGNGLKLRVDAVDAAVPAEAKEAVEEYNTELATVMERRDEKMAGRIVKVLRNQGSKGKSNFFAVGVMHLVGLHNNIVDKLRAAGYKVERVVKREKQMYQSTEWNIIMHNEEEEEEDVEEEERNMEEMVEVSFPMVAALLLLLLLLTGILMLPCKNRKPIY